MLGWRPDDPCMALSGRGVALGEVSGRIGELENGNRVLESIQHHIYIFPCILMCESGIVPMLFELTKSKI